MDNDNEKEKKKKNLSSLNMPLSGNLGSGIENIPTLGEHTNNGHTNNGQGAGATKGDNI